MLHSFGVEDRRNSPFAADATGRNAKRFDIFHEYDLCWGAAVYETRGYFVVEPRVE